MFMSLQQTEQCRFQQPQTLLEYIFAEEMVEVRHQDVAEDVLLEGDMVGNTIVIPLRSQQHLIPSPVAQEAQDQLGWDIHQTLEALVGEVVLQE